MNGVNRVIFVIVSLLFVQSSYAYPVFNIATNAEVIIRSKEAALKILSSLDRLAETLKLAEAGELEAAENELNTVYKEVIVADQIITELREVNNTFGDLDFSNLEEEEFSYLLNYLEKNRESIDGLTSEKLVSLYHERLKLFREMIESVLERTRYSSADGEIEYDSLAIAAGPIIGDIISVGGCITKLLN